MGLLGSYAGRLRLHALRRKSTLLFLFFALVLFVLCLQYNSASRPEAGISNNLIGKDDDKKMEDFLGVGDLFHVNRGGSVQFVQAPSVTGEEHGAGVGSNVAQEYNSQGPLSQFLSKSLLRLPEQPSRDDYAKRKDSMDQFTAGRVLAEASTPGLSLNIQGMQNDQNRVDSYEQQSLYAMGIPYVNLDSKHPYIPPHRIVHFDLKGAPPKVGFVKKVISLVKQLGATGVLLEWEDMFPFTGQLAPIRAGNAYSRTDVEDIIDFARSNQLEVIPLVQTFGHVEFALKHEEFSSLREVPESPQALCPSNNASIEFIEKMIEQVMELHRSVKYLHIGCDEVFQMGECPRCRQFFRDNLFLAHVAKVANFVRRRYPNVIPIVWDDMLRHLPPQSLEEYHIGELVEPMVWVYAEDVYRFVPSIVWEKYAAIFPRIWSASAFKGAFGETMYVPNAKRHLENNLRWLEVMTSEGPKFKKGFAGIVLTGWQRYDHFAVLCELLPGAIPSLAVSLLATSHGFFNQTLRSKLYGGLGCPQPGSSPGYGVGFVNFNSDPFLWDKFARCFFPGSSFFKLLYRLHAAEREVKEFLDTTTRSKGWLTEYNVRRNYTSPLRVDELMADHSRVYHTLTSLVRSARDSLEEIFDVYTIAEWVEQRIYPDLKKLEKLHNDSIALKSVKYWQSRPLPPLRELNKLGLAMPDDPTPLPPKR